MANKTIFSGFFRVSFPHLDKPQKAQKPTDPDKYGISMMFPKSGICPINNQPTSYQNIIDALNACTMEEWNLPYEQAIAPGMGVSFPPNFKDGDTVFVKDSNGNPIPGQIAPETAGMWILSVKNVDPIGCAGPDGCDIAPSAIYGGSWARAQLECSAYETTPEGSRTKARIIVVKLINVQLCYNDTPFGNKTVYEPASKAFSGMSVADTNVAIGTGQAGSMPAVAPAPPGPAAPPAAPPAVPAQAGPAAPPAAPAQAGPAAPPAPPAPPAAPAQAGPAVVMNPGEASYEQMIAAGWTDELLIQHGKGVPNYLG